MKKIDATNIIKTMNWIMSVDEDCQSVIEPMLNNKGTFECVINLPLIDKLVIGIGDSKIESIDNATIKASQLIDSYLDSNPLFKFQNYFGCNQYFLEETDDGFLSIVLSKHSEN